MSLSKGFEISGGILNRYIGNDSVVIIPEDVCHISASAFLGCSNITELHIPDSVKTIDMYAFISCKALKHVNIGFGLTAIPVGAFFELPHLEYVSITDNITAINNFAFKDCKLLKKITFLTKKYRDPITPAEKGYAFELLVSGKPAKIEYVDLSEHGPETLTVGNYSFAGCSSFDIKQISTIATYVGLDAFLGCSSGEDISMPQSTPEPDLGAFCESQHTAETVFDEAVNEQELPVIQIDVTCDKTEKSETASLGELGNAALDVDISDTTYQPDDTAEEPVGENHGISEVITLPELIPDVPILAEDFVAVDGIILYRKDNTVIPDIPISVLNLSVRSYNALMSSGKTKAYDLIGLSYEELLKIRNLGKLSANEIQEKLEQYLNNACQDSNSLTAPMDAPEKNVDKNPVIPEVITLPELMPGVPVLAEDFAAVDGIIVSRKNKKVISNGPISDLDLSFRSYNALMRARKANIYDLVGLPYEALRTIRNLGTLSANEIQEKLEQYLENACQDACTPVASNVICSSTEILKVMRAHEYEYLSTDEICAALQCSSAEDMLVVLDQLESDGTIVKQGNTYGLFYKPFMTYVEELANASKIDERTASVIKMRAEGSTLDAIGQFFNLSRERVRQIEKRLNERVFYGTSVRCKEDRYAYFFATYAVEKDFFSEFMQDSDQLWYYLNFRYSRGSKDIADALEDEKIPSDLRQHVDNYVHRGLIQIDGKYIPLQRSALEDYVIEKYCKDEVSIDEFFALYTNFIHKHELFDASLQINDSSKWTRQNRLADSKKLLWKQNQRLRYYDIEGRDYSELLETLNLGKYEDVELSTRKFLLDYPDLMAQYDLRDEYEIHNLLKKIHAESENSTLVFSRMPILKIGNFDRDRAVKELLFTLAPISQDDFAEAVECEYGIRAYTVKSNWLSCISEYYHQGMYSTDSEEMPTNHIAELKRVLTEDFYYMPELKKIYKSQVPDADLSLLSAYNLKKMGFVVGTTYVLQNHPSLEAFFENLLTAKDIVDIEPISKRYTYMYSYYWCLSRLKHEMTIIEFEPFHYINIRRLEKLGFGRDRLSTYGDRVWSFLLDDDFFTIQSLKKAGYDDELDSLGFGDVFYSSLLKEDKRFSWQKVGNTIVFNPKREPFTGRDFLIDRVLREKSIDIDDLVAMLNDVYGISFDKYTIIEKVTGSDIYYDAIMKKLYADYETYFEEV